MNILALINKNDLMSIIKSGYVLVNIEQQIIFDGDIYKLRDNKQVEHELFEYVNPFEYSYEMVLVHYKNNSSRLSNKIQFEDIVSIYALDKPAQIELSEKFRFVKINLPIWEDSYICLQEKIAFYEAKKGINNLWTIFGLPEERKEKICKNIIPDEDIEEFVKEMIRGIKPEGELSRWVYLLRYERHSLYPKDDRGFFIDACHAYLNFNNKQSMVDVPKIEETEYVKGILNINPTSSFATISNLIVVSDYAKKYLETLRFNCGKEFYAVSSMFLMMSNKIFKEGFKVNSSYNGKNIFDYINSLKEYCHEANLSLVVYLLGIVFGHMNTYECYYTFLNNKKNLKEHPTKDTAVVAKPVNTEEVKNDVPKEEKIKDEKEPTMTAVPKEKKKTTGGAKKASTYKKGDKEVEVNSNLEGATLEKSKSPKSNVKKSPKVKATTSNSQKGKSVSTTDDKKNAQQISLESKNIVVTNDKTQKETSTKIDNQAKQEESKTDLFS